MEETTLDRVRFQKMFKDRAVVVTQLPPGYSRELARRVTAASGRRDVSLRTKDEHLALFELLLEEADVLHPAGHLALLDGTGQPTAAGRAIEDYVRASQGKGEFFEADMYLVRVTGFPLPRRILARPLTSAGQPPARGVAHRSGGSQAHSAARRRGRPVQHLGLLARQLR